MRALVDRKSATRDDVFVVPARRYLRPAGVTATATVVVCRDLVERFVPGVARPSRASVSTFWARRAMYHHRHVAQFRLRNGTVLGRNLSCHRIGSRSSQGPCVTPNPHYDGIAIRGIAAFVCWARRAPKSTRTQAKSSRYISDVCRHCSGARCGAAEGSDRRGHHGHGLGVPGYADQSLASCSARVPAGLV